VIQILRDLPFFDHETTIALATGKAVIRPFQVVVWVSITRDDVMSLDSAAPRFPAVIDTGNNHNFSLQEEQLFSLAGTSLANHLRLGRVWIGQQTVPVISANVWLHCNKTGERDAFSGRPAVCLELPEGIAVYPPHVLNAVRLPTLGLRALARNGLRLVVDGKKMRVSLQK
jgi:hypothetical protein